MTPPIQLYSRRAKRTPFSFFVAIWLIACTITVLNSAFHLPLNYQKVVVAGMGLLPGLFGIRLLCWYIFGKEMISITSDGYLQVNRSGTFLLHQRQFALSEILRLGLYENLYEQVNGYDGFSGLVTHMRNRIFPVLRIQNVGRVMLYFRDNRTYRILNGLSPEEGQQVIEVLNTYLPSVPK